MKLRWIFPKYVPIRPGTLQVRSTSTFPFIFQTFIDCSLLYIYFFTHDSLRPKADVSFLSIIARVWNN